MLLEVHEPARVAGGDEQHLGDRDLALDVDVVERSRHAVVLDGRGRRGRAPGRRAGAGSAMRPRMRPDGRGDRRARREMQQRVQDALDRLPELEAIKRRNGGKSEARASTTDAEASVMKMADGGFRPAYNTQFASDCDTLVIVGVEVSTSGSDMAQLAPMVAQVEQRLGQAAPQWLVDGGFPAHEQIDAVADKTEVYAPVPEPRAKKDDEGNDIVQDKHEPKPGDSPAVKKWRKRMASDEAKALYKLRAATAECVNAQARNRGLQRMPVRGRAKARCVALLYALAHNLMRTVALVPELLGLGQTPSACIAGAA